MNNQEKNWEINEYEIKPNLFAVKILYVLLAIIVVCELLNEFGIFRVGKDIMRFGTLASAMVMVLPIVLINNSSFCANRYTKYLVLGSLFMATFIISVMMNLHAPLCLIVPLLVGMQYPDRKLWGFALLGGVIISFVAPVIAYVAKTMDYAFISYLNQLMDSSVVFKTGEYTVDYQRVSDIMLYLSLPQSFVVIGYGYLLDSVNKTVISHVENKRDLMNISETDALTGLGNRTAYEKYFPSIPSECRCSISCIYIDANGLHELNNSKGHKAGDIFLKTVAEGMRVIFGKEHIYRIGGDEFVAFIKDRNEKEIQSMVNLFCRMVENEHYSVAVGAITSTDLMCDMETLIGRSETAMYTDKRNHYENIRKPSWEKN